MIGKGFPIIRIQLREFSYHSLHQMVIYLVEDSPIVDGYYEVMVPPEFTVHRFQFKNIKLWEIPGEVLKQEELSGLLPLLPLTKGGKSQEVVEEAIEYVQQAGKTDLLPLLYAFSALTFKKKKEQQWLKERFESMGDILESSWAYREMVQKGVVKGLEKGLKQGKERHGARRHPFCRAAFSRLSAVGKATGRTDQNLSAVASHPGSIVCCSHRP